MINDHYSCGLSLPGIDDSQMNIIDLSTHSVIISYSFQIEKWRYFRKSLLLGAQAGVSHENWKACIIFRRGMAINLEGYNGEN